MTKQRTIETWASIRNGHGGSRNAGKKLNRMPSPIEEVERTAGDWIPIGIAIGIEKEIENGLGSPGFFNSFEMADDGYLAEEILSPEDMYPAMYRRIMNG